jgi:hypothetical protein
VEIAVTSEHVARDALAGVARELEAFRFIEPIQCEDQAEYPLANQVSEFHDPTGFEVAHTLSNMEHKAHVLGNVIFGVLHAGDSCTSIYL